MIRTFFPFEGNCDQIAWSPNGRFLALRDALHTSFFLYDVEKKMRVPWIVFQDDQSQKLLENISSLAWSPTSTHLALGKSNGCLIIDPLTGARIHTIALSQDWLTIQSITWSPDGRRLALTTWNEKCFLYEVSCRKMQETQAIPWCSNDETPGSISATLTHGWRKWGAPKKTMLLLSHCKAFLMVDPDGRTHQGPKEDFPITLSSCAMSPTGRYVALASTFNPHVHLYCFGQEAPFLQKTKIYQPEPLYLPDHEHSSYNNEVSLLAWSHDSTYLAISFNTNLHRIYIFNRRTGITIQVLEAEGTAVRSLAWGPNGLLCCGGKGYFQISQIF